MADSSGARWWAMGATALTLLVVGLDMTVLNVALPDMASDLHASTAQLQWFADAYLLVLAAVMLPAGMLGDRLGRKGLTMGALAVFGLGSLWCALATSPGSLIGARVLLGLGAAVIVPLAMSAVVVLFDPPERPRAVLLLSMASMIGLPLGPILGGVLLQHFWWGSVFVVNLPVIAFALVAVGRFFPAGRAPGATGGFDGVGVVLSGVGLFALTYGVIEGPTRGWGDPVVLGGVVGGLAVLAAFLVHERRLTAAVPVFDVAIWAVPAFRWGAVVASIVGLALFGVFFTLPQYFRAVLGTDALGSGLRTLPLVVGMLLAMQLTARAAAGIAPRVLAPVGCILLAAALALGATTQVGDGFGLTAVWTTLAGTGVGVALFSAQNTALLALPRDRAATGSALIQTLRQAGSVFGIAVLGALLNDRYRDQVDTAGLAPAQVAAVRDSAQTGLQVADSTGAPDLAHSVASAFVSGMDRSLWASAGVAVLAAVLAAWLLPGTSGPPTDAGESQDADDAPEQLRTGTA
jgi:DHA2 family multidrug resistance protein-like MFS transporter